MPKDHRETHTADWENKLGDFLRFNDREVLQNFDTVSREFAESVALEQYEKYDAHRREPEAADIGELETEVEAIDPARNNEPLIFGDGSEILVSAYYRRYKRQNRAVKAGKTQKTGNDMAFRPCRFQ